jgi:hypothetical protein
MKTHFMVFSKTLAAVGTKAKCNIVAEVDEAVVSRIEEAHVDMLFHRSRE